MQAIIHFLSLCSLWFYIFTTAFSAALPVTSSVTGTATLFTPNGTIGTCGTSIQDTQPAVIVSNSLRKQGANCGQKLAVSYNAGPVILVTVQDFCRRCAKDEIALTPGGMEMLNATMNNGPVDVVYNFAS